MSDWVALLAKLMNDPTPTTGAASERHLAVGMGYPSTWRVCRRLLPPLTSALEETSDENGIVVKEEQEGTEGTVSKQHPHRLRLPFQDVIYAGNPNKGVDRWYCHEAAQAAAVSFSGNPYAAKGGHLLKAIPKYKKGDLVEVKYARKWYGSKIIKSKTTNEGISYSVLYTVDESTQENVKEADIRFPPPSSTALALATEMGFPVGWEAVRKGGKKITYTSPTGDIFTSKKAALEHVRAAGSSTNNDDDDPPWRKTGHVLLGRRIFHHHSHKLSGARSVTVEQVGTVVGWICSTDKDRHGKPGYVSEETGKPASLFHVTFSDQPGHAYPKHLIESMDVEEEEVMSMLIEEGQQPPKKRSRNK